MVAYEIFSRRQPFDDVDCQQEVAQAVVAGQRPLLPTPTATMAPQAVVAGQRPLLPTPTATMAPRGSARYDGKTR
jgi:hypothetical protein